MHSLSIGCRTFGNSDFLPQLKVSYRVQYSNSSTDIVDVMVEFFLGSVTAEIGLAIRQKVSVRFSKVSTEGSL